MTSVIFTLPTASSLFRSMRRPSCFRYCVRPLSSSSSKTSWGRNAMSIKDTDKNNKGDYMEHLRDMHDPSQHIKTLEDEIRGTMGKALGKQGQKILMYLKLMQQEKEAHDDLLLLVNAATDDADDDDNATNSNKLLIHAKQHNDYRKHALTARWELLVHRQAVGFIVNNHNFVHSKFPIPEALPEGKESSNNSPKKEQTTKFGSQLDWWQRIGRWK